MNKDPGQFKGVPPPEACSDSVCAMLDRVGVPRDSKWRGLILYMRSIKNYDFLDNEQKEQLQALGMEVLKARDFSEAKFQEIIKANERILSAPWNLALTRTLQETASLVQEFQGTLLKHKGGVQKLEKVTIEAVESGGDVERMLGTIRRGFKEMATLIEEDAEKMVAMSLTDSLTGIHNRRAFDTHIEKAVVRAEAEQRPLALFMCDIDHFKNFNDQHGHRIGDQALVVVGSILKGFAEEMKQLEDRDIFPARYGGEEFAVTLFNIGKEEAEELAEIIRRKIERYNFVIRDPDGQILASGIKINVSIGVAELLVDCPGCGVAHLVDAADKALYLAKSSGRNQVRVYVRP
ncbi:diguanylate cyclase [Solidesulfovibrio fructosivorans JJ]]|uniref:diguanylate cyclase n=1 Tax=Solidesulfovibrio fructosivorans JJ] TaxID=596151 RepID=E1JYG1_SOLFR|nr:GGDEF domain-containing protein [Solidesulfovibrio fructosivorans]EFL50545.1 diguanylate cyclase [Solidesulfovibrio fructosivorans JJ]]